MKFHIFKYGVDGNMIVDELVDLPQGWHSCMQEALDAHVFGALWPEGVCSYMAVVLYGGDCRIFWGGENGPPDLIIGEDHSDSDFNVVTEAGSVTIIGARSAEVVGHGAAFDGIHVYESGHVAVEYGGREFSFTNDGEFVSVDVEDDAKLLVRYNGKG